MVSVNRSFAVLAAPKREAREAHVKRPWIAVGLTVALMTGVGTPSAQAVEGSVFQQQQYKDLGTASSKTGGVVAAGNREAALAGLKMLDDGGNAVDAAAAAMFAVGVAQFDSCGMGGGGFMVYRSAGGEVDTIDFREWSPKNYVYTNGFGVNAEVYAWGGGHNVVGIPGSVAGIDLALKKHGTRPLKQDPLHVDRMSVLQPAIDLAVNGFTVPKFVADYIANPFVAARLAVFPATAAIYMGAPAHHAAGQKMLNLPLAEDMLELKRLGAEAFYNPDLPGGTIADDLLTEMMYRPSPFLNDRPEGSGWEAEDLKDYRAISRPAVRTRYRGSEYIGMAAPSSAGTAVAEVLNILEGYDLRAAGQSSADQVHLFAEAMKLAWRDRAQYLADPAFTPTPAHLTSKEHANSLRNEIDLRNAKAFGGTAPHGEGPNTHNIAVIDKWGNAVALNCSIEQPMGSGVTAPGTGFLLNNQLTDFDNDPNEPDHVNKPEPRKRPRSSQGPAIVVRQGQPTLVTGGVGGAGIIAATTSAVINVVDFRQDVAHAIDAERAEPRGNCPHDEGLQLCAETTRFDPDVLKDLGARGHRLKLSSANPWIPCFGNGACEYAAQPFTHSAGVNPATGERQAASDPRVFASGQPTGLAAVAQAGGG